MERKYKITEKVICTGQVGDIFLDQEKGMVTGYNRVGTYYVKFGHNGHASSGYVLELHENQIEDKSISSFNISTEIVLIPSGEVLKLSKDKHLDYIRKRILRWDNEYNCYVVPDTLKNSLF